MWNLFSLRVNASNRVGLLFPNSFLAIIEILYKVPGNKLVMLAGELETFNRVVSIRPWATITSYSLAFFDSLNPTIKNTLVCLLTVMLLTSFGTEK